MMNRQNLDMIWDHLRQMNGITVRLVDALPEAQLDSHPIPNMRTPKELVVHLYGGMIRGMAEGVASGEIKELDENAACAAIRTREDLSRYCAESWKAADQAMKSVTDAQLNGRVRTPWGEPAPAAAIVQAIRDELTHHRGQLFVFVRALGGDVPMMWDFAHNAPEFQPKPQPAKV